MQSEEKNETEWKKNVRYQPEIVQISLSFFPVLSLVQSLVCVLEISADKFLIFQHMDWMRVDWTAWHFLAAPIAIVIVGDDFTSTENIDRNVQEKDKQTARKREAMRCNECRWKEKNIHTHTLCGYLCVQDEEQRKK